MKDKIISGLKIIMGALITSAIVCVVYFGSYELIFLLKETEWFDCIIVILGCSLLFIMQFALVIVHIAAYWLCKKRKYLTPYQSKMMLLMSTFSFVAMGYWAAGVYCIKLGFEDGLGFVLGSLITLGIAGIWALILIVLLIVEKKLQ